MDCIQKIFGQCLLCGQRQVDNVDEDILHNVEGIGYTNFKV